MIGRGEGEGAPSRVPAPRAEVGNGVVFVDANYVRWRVIERDARRDPGARGDRCLIFACDMAMRRVWDYPPEWRELSAEALVALSWRR